MDLYSSDLKASFHQAIADSKSLGERPSNDTLLQLYSFYKQATEGDAPAESPANPLDFIGAAKYNAWLRIKNMTRETAMQQYIDLVNKLKY